MLTPHCSAVSGMVAPSSTAPITRARKSSEYGFAIHAGLLPAGSLNHIRAGMGIPLRFSLFGKRSSGVLFASQRRPYGGDRYRSDREQPGAALPSFAVEVDRDVDLHIRPLRSLLVLQELESHQAAGG